MRHSFTFPVTGAGISEPAAVNFASRFLTDLAMFVTTPRQGKCRIPQLVY